LGFKWNPKLNWTQKFVTSEFSIERLKEELSNIAKKLVEGIIINGETRRIEITNYVDTALLKQKGFLWNPDSKSWWCSFQKFAAKYGFDVEKEMISKAISIDDDDNGSSTNDTITSNDTINDVMSNADKIGIQILEIIKGCDLESANSNVSSANSNVSSNCISWFIGNNTCNDIEDVDLVAAFDAKEHHKTHLRKMGFQWSVDLGGYVTLKNGLKTSLKVDDITKDILNQQILANCGGNINNNGNNNDTSSPYIEILSLKKTQNLHVFNSINIKDKLKSLRFSFDKVNKSWYVDAKIIARTLNKPMEKIQVSDILSLTKLMV